MPHDPGSPASWLRFARSDLAIARQPAAGDVLLETLCFHAPQAVEKSIKAVLVHSAVPAPSLHSIERLIDLLPPDLPRTADLIASAQLTDYATVFRYPGEETPVSNQEYREALRLAEAVVAWAEGVAAGRSV
ncbi:MAG TPA: HEPN domain-containing protein [Armatimonadota bacterium]|nr:HEPN domain-containing protein [Armatimonadota bacterium]